jgi:hypothetical protein
MGDPRNSERAKKEIFTQVYGKFDQKVFDLVVKKTTESEEARQLTDKYGKPSKRAQATVDKKSKKSKKQKPTTGQMGRARDILRQRIKNPKTGREIFVATALGYEPTDPMRKKAEKLLSQALKKQ